MYYSDLRAFLGDLERRGKLHRFAEAVDKDRELIPLLRVELRGLPDAERKVLLFENVTDATGHPFEMRVAAGAYGVSEGVVALGMGCESPAEMVEHWHQALENPIAPKIVDSGPVHEEVHLGDELQECGLDEIPAPLEEPGYSQIVRTGVPMITRDPDTGMTNVGAYNGFFRDRTRMVAGIGLGQHAMRYHWPVAKRRNEDLPVAIVIGATPNVMLVGSGRIPYGVDELAVAGGLAGEALELVRCKTVPLEVPAHAEIVIEGLISTSIFEPRLAFGEYPGYMNVEMNPCPVLNVTAITHRKHAIFTPVLVGFSPSDTNAINGAVNAGMLYHQLRYACHLPVAEVCFPEMGGGVNFCVIRLKQEASSQAWQVLEAAAGLWASAKFVVAVDHDVNPRDPELLVWALSFRVRPEKDIAILRGRRAGLDPSFGPTGSSRGRTEPAGSPSEYFKVLVDATTSGAYPPIALPKREFMERAVELWRRHPELPEPRLREPWHGYELGYWTSEDQRLADLMVAGDYKAVGRATAEMRVSAEEAMR